MPTELWEYVRADELKTQDVVAWSQMRCRIIGIWWNDDKDMIRFQFCTDDNHYFQEKVFYRLHVFRLYPRPLWKVLRNNLALLQAIRADGYTPGGDGTLSIDVRISELKDEVGNEHANAKSN